MVLGTNIKQVTACFQISTFEEKLLKKCIKNKLFHSLSGDGIEKRRMNKAIIMQVQRH